VSNPEKLISLANDLRNAAIRMMQAGAAMRDTHWLAVQASASRKMEKQLTAAQTAIDAIRKEMSEI
jgi:hypothetical protein